jgi:hypothetical protein
MKTSFPSLFENALQVSTKELKQWDYFKSAQIRSGVITWSRNGKESNSISIKVTMRENNSYLQLDYTSDGESVSYCVDLISIPSNLGFGKIWYFLCPLTNRKSRKLYLHKGKFQSCYTLPNMLYEKQTQSKEHRFLEQTYGGYFKADKLYEQMYEKHFRKTYAGKPTKKYLKIMRELKMYEHISFSDIKGMLYK